MNLRDCQQATAQIHAGSGAVVGTGFLIAKQYLLTCAHVVQAALAGQPDGLNQTVTATFSMAQPERVCSTRVICYELHELDDPDPEKRRRDFAVLYIAEPLSIEPVAMRPLAQLSDLPVKSYGFPKGDRLGRHLEAAIAGEVGAGWVQLQGTETGLAIEAGFSGAPVWCARQTAVIGMIVARDRKRPEAKTGFMIPVAKLQRPLRAVEWHSLWQILAADQAEAAQPMAAAYQHCRPEHWPQPWQTALLQQLQDLAEMPAGQTADPPDKHC
ncbi:MAG: trypsin-like peptidase domain-containing protein [Leptolyngbya sp. SIO4C1]|nr:trypsin-like peptidase domain-containing protein [Leptolyngbya sp. SIO4C1]